MSTAKSMATSYLNGRRAGNGQQQNKFRFKSSTSNLASLTNGTSANSNGRLKSTSMTNLIADNQPLGSSTTNNNINSRIQRPASRNALDSIHNGMNAKYAQIQSKVLLQNIRPNNGTTTTTNNTITKSKSHTLQSGSNYGRTSGAAKQHAGSLGGNNFKVPSDRTQLINKIKALQDELDKFEEERENFKQELEREKSDKNEQIQQLKQELQDKLADHDKQHEEYHQKLLEAYELADQNRRAADNVLNESRQRDEESRKKIEELENQLAELKEFVTMKEEMTTKMFELREQIREERERYEEQLKSLHQVFENEKLRHAELEAEQIVKGKSGSAANQNGSSTTSNYFKRIKPSLQSNESINKLDSSSSNNNSNATKQCKHCYKLNNKRLQVHHSEQDIYGSKLSTRMHDTARSAWKASKQFASSVITGSGVGISACRKRTTSSVPKSAADSNVQAVSCRESKLSEELAVVSNLAHNEELALRHDEEQQLTSVVKVESSTMQQQHQPQSIVSINVSNDQNHLIRVDENNKLTIVTKFNEMNDYNNHSIGTSASPNGPATASSSSFTMENSNSNCNQTPVICATTNGSERSRCESSSSGRGTSSSDAGSAASQNGDGELVMPIEHHHQKHSPVNSSSGSEASSKHSPSQIANINHNHQMSDNNNNNSEIITTTMLGGKEHKQHRRKSSLFKANAVFGNGSSQVNLNKLKYFFTGREMSANKLTITPSKPSANQQVWQQQQHRQSHDLDAGVIASEKHLENSRLRCMELNRAINVPSMSPAMVLNKHHQQQHEPDEQVADLVRKQEECGDPVGGADTNELNEKLSLSKKIAQKDYDHEEEIRSPGDRDSTANKDGEQIRFVGQGEEEGAAGNRRRESDLVERSEQARLQQAQARAGAAAVGS